MTHGLLTWKRIVALVVLLATVVVLIVSSLWLDHRTDRRRPMFRALVQMQGLQWDLLQEGKPAQPLVVKRHDRPIEIAGHLFTVPHGVTVRVEDRAGSTCVFAENEFGDHTRWECIDPKGSRPSLGGLQ